MAEREFYFPEWVNRARPLVGILLAGVPVYALALLYFGGSPETTDVGYSPKQPVPFSHEVHAGQMGLDCRYCHWTVESAAFAAVPSSGSCMNCHESIGPDIKDLEPLRQSVATGDPIRWVRVHDLPDYVYFDHGAHVRRGVGCVSCHGRIDKMEQVYQAKTLSMAWCLECHRDPAPHLRPAESITDMDWKEGSPDLGQTLMADSGIQPSTDCSTCHR